MKDEGKQNKSLKLACVATIVSQYLSTAWHFTFIDTQLILSSPYDVCAKCMDLFFFHTQGNSVKWMLFLSPFQMTKLSPMSKVPCSGWKEESEQKSKAWMSDSNT